MENTPLFHQDELVKYGTLKEYNRFLHQTLGECIKLSENKCAILKQNGTYVRDIVSIPDEELVTPVPYNPHRDSHRNISNMLIGFIFEIERGN